jgi:hypothetical protein
LDDGEHGSHQAVNDFGQRSIGRASRQLGG